MASLSWKERSGRKGGTDSYKFGDLTRIVVNATIGGYQKLQFKFQSMLEPQSQSEQLPRQKLLFGTFDDLLAHSPVPVTDRPHSLEMQRIWLSFFNACFACGVRSIQTGILSSEDVEDCEPYLFLGLPALAASECCIRSVGRTGLVLSDNSLAKASELSGDVEVSICAQMMELVSAFEAAQAATGTTGPLIDAAELQVLRVKVLHASGDAMICGNPQSDVLLNQLCGKAVSIATQASQLVFFRGAFMLVIEALREHSLRQATESKVVNTSGRSAEGSA